MTKKVVRFFKKK